MAGEMPDREAEAGRRWDPVAVALLVYFVALIATVIALLLLPAILG